LVKASSFFLFTVGRIAIFNPALILNFQMEKLWKMARSNLKRMDQGPSVRRVSFPMSIVGRIAIFNPALDLLRFVI